MVSCNMCKKHNLINKKCKGTPAIGIVQGFDDETNETYETVIEMPYSYQKNRNGDCNEFVPVKFKLFRKLYDIFESNTNFRT